MFVIKKTSSGSVLSGTGLVSSVVLVGGTANSSVAIDNSTDGSGDVKIELKSLANDSKTFTPSKPIEFSTAVYATLAGTGAKLYVYFA